LKSIFSDKKNTNVLQPCVVNIPGSELSTTSTGDPLVMYKKDDLDTTSAGHGGLKFYDNNRVWTIDNKMSGVYSCTPSGEIKAQVSESLMNEAAPTIKITWDQKKIDDGNKTDDGKKTDNSGTKYFDCSTKDFPLEFGCISPKIAEIQCCLGVKPQKGYFGPITMKAIGGSKVITKEIYDKIKSNCKGQSTDTSTSTTSATKPGYTPKGLGKVDASKFDYLNSPSGGDTSNNTASTQTTQETPEQLYSRLTSNYQKLDDNGNPTYPFIKSEGDRIKYKGPEITDASILKGLNDLMAQKGYKSLPIKSLPKEASYGFKYVWEK
jgi:hypothetical protein